MFKETVGRRPKTVHTVSSLWEPSCMPRWGCLQSWIQHDRCREIVLKCPLLAAGTRKRWCLRPRELSSNALDHTRISGLYSHCVDIPPDSGPPTLAWRWNCHCFSHRSGVRPLCCTTPLGIHFPSREHCVRLGPTTHYLGSDYFTLVKPKTTYFFRWQ